jgi:hypothetical protein
MQWYYSATTVLLTVLLQCYCSNTTVWSPAELSAFSSLCANALHVSNGALHRADHPRSFTLENIKSMMIASGRFGLERSGHSGVFQNIPMVSPSLQTCTCSIMAVHTQTQINMHAMIIHVHTHGPRYPRIDKRERLRVL